MSWTRRRLLEATAGLSMAPAILRSAKASCQGGIAKIGMEFAGWSIDPLHAHETDDVILRNILAPLVRFDGTTGGIAPHLAENWDIGDDGKVVTITLRPERWLDGTDIEATDVADSIELLAAADQLKHIKGAQARDSKTVEIYLDQGDPDLFTIRLPTRLGCILSMALREEIRVREEAVKTGSAKPLTFKEVINGPPVTSGTYHLVSLDSDRAVLEVAPTWLGSKPVYERVGFVNIPGLSRGSQEALDLARSWLLQNEICAYAGSAGFSGFQRIAFRQAQNSGVSYTFPSARTYALIMRADNEVELPHELREAIAAVLDPETVSNSLKMVGAARATLRATASLLPTVAGFESPEPDRNLDKAQGVLREFGRELRLVWPVFDDPYYELVAEAATTILQEHGLAVEMRPVPFEALQAGLQAGVVPFDVVVMRQTMYPSGAFDILQRFTRDDPLNFARLDRPELDERIEEGSTTLDFEKRQELGSRALEILMQDDVVAAPLAEAYTTWTVAPEVKPDFTPYGAIGDLALWA